MFSSFRFVLKLNSIDGQSRACKLSHLHGLSSKIIRKSTRFEQHRNDIMFELPHPSTRAALLRGAGQRWYRAHCLEPRAVSRGALPPTPSPPPQPARCSAGAQCANKNRDGHVRVRLYIVRLFCLL